MKRERIAVISLLVAATLVLAATVGATQWPNRSTLPIPLSPFEGKIAKTYKESEPDWPTPPPPQTVRPTSSSSCSMM